MSAVVPVVFPLVVACVLGAGAVRWLWPRREPLGASAWIGLSALFGPAIAGHVMLAVAAAGATDDVTRTIVTACGLVAGALALWRHRASRRPCARDVTPGHRERPGQTVAIAIVLTGIITCTTALALRTHLGWDGTVVWYHKARIIIGHGGVLPAAYLRDDTRIWTAPDYPLHVPLAMAWPGLWQPVEDERGIKVVPAVWLAGLLLVVYAGVLERGRRTASAQRWALGGVILLATAPRLLVGEGSLTSGYADGPLSALVVALLWTTWRSGWGQRREWMPLMASLAALLAWTKQEGVIPVLIVAAVCASAGNARSAWRRCGFAGPALLVAGGWWIWVSQHGATTGMAYALGQAAGFERVAVILASYLSEPLRLRTWGGFWVGLILLSWGAGRHIWRPALIPLGMLTAGAAAFYASAWVDLPAHLGVTVPRQFLQVAPVCVLVALSAPADRDSADPSD